MSTFLTRVNAIPLQFGEIPFSLYQWISVLVDELNETLNSIEAVIFYRDTVAYTPFDALNNTTYIVTNAATATINLPDEAAVGVVVSLVGSGAGGWVLVPGSGQTIKVNASSAGVSITSTNQYDCISIMCIDANTTWVTTSSQTSGFVIA